MTFTAGIENLGYVVRIFHELDLASKWQSIGQTLQVSVDGLSEQFNHNPKSCLLHVIATWLQGQTTLTDPPPSWKGVVWVIADDFGGGTYRGAQGVAKKFKGVQSGQLLHTLVTVNNCTWQFLSYSAFYYIQCM